MFNKDNKFKLNTSKPEKKVKKEKVPKEKSEGGKLFGGKGFGKESGGKLSGAPKKERKGISFDFLKRKEKEGKISTGFSNGGGKLSGGGSKGSLKERFAWVKWWHIVIAAVVLVAIIVGIVLGVRFARIKNALGGNDDTPYVPEGTVTTVGTFLSSSTQDYILCEYKEHFSGKTSVSLKTARDIRFNYKSYYILVYDGQEVEQFSGEFTGNYTHEQTKASLLSLMKSAVGYTDEQIALCDVRIYEPVSFTKVKLSSATLTSDNKATVKYQTGAVDGDLSAEYTLNGTYTKNENNITFAYTNLPEDAALRRVADKLLTSAKYSYFDGDGSWMNTLTFGDKITLTLITAE